MTEFRLRARNVPKFEEVCKDYKVLFKKACTKNCKSEFEFLGALLQDFGCFWKISKTNGFFSDF